MEFNILLVFLLLGVKSIFYEHGKILKPSDVIHCTTHNIEIILLLFFIAAVGPPKNNKLMHVNDFLVGQLKMSNLLNSVRYLTRFTLMYGERLLRRRRGGGLKFI